MSPVCAVHGGSAPPTTPRQSRALSPVYVGCVHFVPLSNEKYTPELPTPGVNGHVLSVPALHASMSISSLEPATSTLGCSASIATAGSFCLFCENGVNGLPTVTRLSGLNAAAVPAPTNNAPVTSTDTKATLRIENPPRLVRPA